MTNSDPEQLLARLRDRDERALADLYDEMGGRAYGLAYQVREIVFSAGPHPVRVERGL